MNTRKIQIYFFRILMILALALSLAGYTPGVSARVTDETGVVKPVELQQAPGYPIRAAGAGLSHTETKYPIRAEANVPLSLTAANPVSTNLPENRHSSIELTAFDEPQAGLVEPLDEASEAVMDVAADAVGSNIMLASGASAKAKLASPFVGSWQAVDVDGSDMTLTIGGSPNGPFQITLTDNYISFCGGEAGLVRGMGVLNETDPNILEADLHLVCFTTGNSTDFHVSWIYDAGTGTISDGDITWLRSSAVSKPCILPPDGLTGWWTGDGDAGDIVAGRDGTLEGDAATGSGLVDLAFMLDGDGDFVDVPSQPAFNVGINDFTVDLWVNFRDTAGEQVLAEKWIQSDLPIGWTLTKLMWGNLRLGIGDGIQDEFDVDTEPLSLRPGIWYQFAATRQGNTIALYLNGELVAINDDVPLMNLNSTTSLKFGRRGDPDDYGFFLNGRIDEVEFFANTALSAEQIRELYNAGSAGKCKDAVPPPPPALDLRVNYGHDWVESFYEAGHTVWVMLTESDGVTVKATAELVTEPKDFWGGETGFTTFPEVWNPAPPDIQPYDWVYAWVDNGASAQMQIGDIQGQIDLAADSITGMINAPWFSGEEEVGLECHPWGAPEPEEMKYDSVFPDGSDPYYCSWAGEWNILPYQDVGVGYSGPDGHWVANAFFAVTPRIFASESGDWFWTSEFNQGPLDISIYEYESEGEGMNLLWNDTRDADESGFVSIGHEDHGQDLVTGNYLVVSDGMNTKGLVLESISITIFGTKNEIMAGFAPAGSEVWAAAGPMDWQERLMVHADPESGAWLADFAAIEFDITEDMRPWSFAHIYDEDGDANEGSTPPSPTFTIFPEWEWFDGMNWPDGVTVSISVIRDGVEVTDCGMSVPDVSGGFFNGGFPEGCDIVVGDVVTFDDGYTTRQHTVQELAITEVDKFDDTVSGTAGSNTAIYAWVHEYDQTYQELWTGDGLWQADFGALGFDLVELMGGRVEVRDEFGNATAVDWFIPNPRFTVWPESERMDGSEWPDGPVTVTVDGKSDCSTVKMSEGGYFNEPFPEGCDIIVDDVVTFSDGKTTRSHTVRNLTITAVDQAADTVTGTADIGEGVSVGAADFGELYLSVEDGTWLADFTSTGIDLVEGMCGYARVDDEVGNVTQADWCIPNPRMTIFPDWEWFDGLEWPDGATVTITVTRDGAVVTECGTLVPDVSGGFFNGGFPEGCNVVPGDSVSMTDGLTSRTHIVRNLVITEVNEEADTVSGIANPYETVDVWPHETGEQLHASVGEDGSWQVDFTDMIDLVPGVAGMAQILDGEGNATLADWFVPNPRLLVQITENWFVAQQFPPSVELTFNIYGLEGGDPLITGSMWTDPSGNASIWVGDQEGGDLQPGYLITVSDGMNNRSIVLEALTFDVFDLTNGHFEGTAPEPFGRTVWVGIGWENEGWSMEVATDGTGNWSAEYGGPVPEGYQWVAAQVFDDDGDASEVRPAPVIEP